MLLHTEADPILSSGLGDGNTFTIAASAKAFEVLSSNLYQNKILAVIREISCNAADAHASVGKPLSDIAVHIPSFSEPYFSCRDYGPGLSHPDVMSLYTTYFRSTKDQSNDMIGGFGLGSKSPFAVADQFTVTSWHGGTKSSYLCYKDSGVPRVNVISQQPSSEPTGLEVRVAATDHSQWGAEASRFFQWWPDLPVLTGAPINVKPFFSEKTSTIRSAATNNLGHPEWAIIPLPRLGQPGSYNVGSIAFMGLVPYSLNLTALPGLSKDAAYHFRNVSLFLSFNVGDLSISPSRETLSYDKPTVAAIEARLAAILSEMRVAFDGKLKSATSLYDARVMAYIDQEYLTNLLYTKGSQQLLLWNGKSVSRDVSLALDGPYADIRYYHYGKHSYWRKPRRFTDDASYLDHRLRSSSGNSKWVWFPTVTAKAYRALSLAAGSHLEWYYHIIAGKTFADAQAFATEVGLPPLEDGTLLPVPAAVPTVRNKTPPTKAYLYKNRSFESSEADVDLTGGGYYLEFFKGEPVDSKTVQLFYLLQRAGLLPTDFRILGFRSTSLRTKTLQAELADKKWQPFTHDWVATNLSTTTIYNHTLTEYISKRASYGKTQKYRLIENLAAAPATLTYTNKDDAAVVNAFRPFIKAGSFTNVGDLLTNTSSYLHMALSDVQKKEIVKATATAERMDKMVEAFELRHPLINYLDKYATIPHNAVLSYINR